MELESSPSHRHMHYHCATRTPLRIETEAMIVPYEYMKKQIQDKERNWVENKTYGQYAREMVVRFDMKRTWI